MIRAAIQVCAVACGLGLPLCTSAAWSQSSTDAAVVKAKGQLEVEQRDAYARLGRTPRSYSTAELDRLDREDEATFLASLSQFPQTTPADIERIMAHLAEARRALTGTEVPTQYEDQLFYRPIATVLLQIGNGAEEFHESHPDIPNPLPDLGRIVIGTRPGDSPNALVKLVNPDEEDKSRRVYLIIIDTGLLRFAEVFSEIVAELAPVTEQRGKLLGVDMSQDAVRGRLDSHPEIAREFQELMTAYLLQGGAYLALNLQARQLTEPYATLAGMIYRGVLVFAVAHELGHVIYDQSDLYKTDDKQLPTGWAEEYSADAWGLTLSLMAMGHNSPLELGVIGARSYFTFYDLVERGISLITTGQDYLRATTNHPPAYQRKERFSRYTAVALRSFWGLEPASIQEFQQLVQTSRLIDNAVEVLWEQAEPGLLELWTEKTQLAPGWGSLSPKQRR